MSIVAEGPLRRTWATAGVRARTTLVAILVVGVVLALGLIGLADRTRERLEDSITSAAETRALDVAALAEADAVSGEIVTITSDQLIQVVAGGEVIAASPGLDGVAPLIEIDTAPGVTEEVTVAEAVFEAIEEQSPLVEDESPYVVISRGYQSATTSGVVLVASSLSPAQAAVGALRPLLVLGFPIALVAVGLTVWSLTGWALRPVEAMREEADTISATALSRRLPVPESKDEVGRLADTLNRMLDRLESSSLRQRRFVSDASHELKTPLATMRTMLEVAADDPEFDDWRPLLLGLRQEGKRMEGLVSDLLALARFDEGAAVSDQEVDLDQVIGRVAEQIGAGFPDVTIETGGIKAARVVGDVSALERLFSNLASNAARHASGRVSFSCDLGGEGVVALVVDDGPGIAADDREKVFERFVRLDEARDRPEGGTGLGLAVARAIARTHGGDVRVANSDAGAVLEVLLPAAE
ncbi:MAG: sensor histidine kinase [Acidimicrobiia bacterium]